MILLDSRDDPRVLSLLGGLAATYVHTYGAHDLDEDDPAEYAAPWGGCLLALDEDGRPVAVGCWRRHDETTCELRRFYVDPGARGRAYASVLFDSVLTGAQRSGYVRALCATTAGQAVEARGGRRIAAYAPGSRDDAPSTCYQLDLRPPRDDPHGLNPLATRWGIWVTL